MLRLLIRELLVENRLEDVREKYPNIEDEIINRLSQGDPSGNNKYLMWMAKELSHGPSRVENEAVQNDIIDTIQRFHKNLARLPEKDINKYGSVHAIEDALDEIPPSKRQQKKEAKATGAEIIYDSNDYLVVFIKSPQAACHYGSGTKWCITNKETFEQYQEEGHFFYFVISKNIPDSYRGHKVAVQADIISSQVVLELWDAEDNKIRSSIEEVFGEEWFEIRNIIEQDVRKRPLPLDPEQRIKRILRLHGFDEDDPDHELADLASLPIPFQTAVLSPQIKIAWHTEQKRVRWGWKIKVVTQEEVAWLRSLDWEWIINELVHSYFHGIPLRNVHFFPPQPIHSNLFLLGTGSASVSKFGEFLEKAELFNEHIKDLLWALKKDPFYPY